MHVLLALLYTYISQSVYSSGVEKNNRDLIMARMSVNKSVGRRRAKITQFQRRKWPRNRGNVILELCYNLLHQWMTSKYSRLHMFSLNRDKPQMARLFQKMQGVTVCTSIPVWILVLTFYIWALTKLSFKHFPFLKEMIGGSLNIWRSNGWFL